MLSNVAKNLKFSYLGSVRHSETFMHVEMKITLIFDVQIFLKYVFSKKKCKLFLVGKMYTFQRTFFQKYTLLRFY